MEQLESISINNLLWVQWKSHLISFRYIGLTKGVHYTISFNENSSYINLHLTKNIKEKSFDKKPKIGICKVKKEDINELFPKIIIKFLFSILEEISDIKSYQDSSYIPFEEFEKEWLKRGADKDLFENFKKMKKLKQNKRLKVKGDIEGKLKQIVGDAEFQENIINNLTPFRKDVVSRGGILLFENEIVSIIKIENKWFRIKSQINFGAILKETFGSKLGNYFEEYINNSLKVIEKANDYEDCQIYDKPVTLQLRKKPIIKEM